jgi:hypothetical protein
MKSTQALFSKFGCSTPENNLWQSSNAAATKFIYNKSSDAKKGCVILAENVPFAAGYFII